MHSTVSEGPQNAGLHCCGISVSLRHLTHTHLPWPAFASYSTDPSASAATCIKHHNERTLNNSTQLRFAQNHLNTWDPIIIIYACEKAKSARCGHLAPDIAKATSRILTLSLLRACHRETLSLHTPLSYIETKNLPTIATSAPPSDYCQSLHCDDI